MQTKENCCVTVNTVVRGLLEITVVDNVFIEVEVVEDKVVVGFEDDTGKVEVVLSGISAAGVVEEIMEEVIVVAGVVVVVVVVGVVEVVEVVGVVEVVVVVVVVAVVVITERVEVLAGG